MSEPRKMPTSNEDYAMMQIFEKIYGKDYRMDKEDKSMWSQKIIYQQPDANALYLAFRHGVAYGRSVGGEK